MKEKLKKIATKATITAADKRFIEEAYKKNGRSLSLNKNCPDCWRDAAVELLRGMDEASTEAPKWRYNASGRSVWTINGENFILDEHTDEKIIERYVAMYGEGLYTLAK